MDLVNPAIDARWATVLDDYETALRSHLCVLEAIDHGSAVELPALFLPPDLLGPVPPSQQPRARRLLEMTTEVLELAQRLHRESRRVGVVPRATATSAAPRLLDTSL